MKDFLKAILGINPEHTHDETGEQFEEAVRNPGGGGGSGGDSIVLNCKYNSDCPDSPIDEAPVFNFAEIRTAIMSGADAIVRAEDTFDDCGDVRIFYLDKIASTNITFRTADNKSAKINSDNTFTMNI